jgi:hypothetical protein
MGMAIAVVMAGASGLRAEDEIQVYNAEINEPGKWSVQSHMNYAIVGRKQAEFPGGLIPNHTLEGTPEFAYGVTPWFEFGFYLPYAVDRDGFHSNAGKVRFLFVTPDAAKRDFWYGVNFEFGYATTKFSETRWNAEIRPIIGWTLGDYELIFNPIVELGFGDKGDAIFTPAARFAKKIDKDLAIGIEYYADLGPIGHILPLKEQGHNIFGVVDFKVADVEVNFGVGYGLTEGSDRWMAKMILSKDLDFGEPKSNGNGSNGSVRRVISK